MAETGFEWLIDGEDAGATPWEFDSISQFGSSTFELSSERVNHGSYAYKGYSDGSNPAYGNYDWTNDDKVEYWVRFYIYLGLISTGHDTYSSFRIFQGSGDGGTDIDFRIRTNDVGEFAYWYLDAPYYQNSGTNFSLDAWHMVEIRHVSHASTGGVEIYIDGDSAISDLDQDTSGEFFNSLQIGVRQAIGSGDLIYIDDLVGDTSQPGAYSSIKLPHWKFS